MLGTDKSLGYCLEMICADILRGAHLGYPWRFLVHVTVITFPSDAECCLYSSAPLT